MGSRATRAFLMLVRFRTGVRPRPHRRDSPHSSQSESLSGRFAAAIPDPNGVPRGDACRYEVTEVSITMMPVR